MKNLILEIFFNLINMQEIQINNSFFIGLFEMFFTQVNKVKNNIN